MQARARGVSSPARPGRPGACVARASAARLGRALGGAPSAQAQAGARGCYCSLSLCLATSPVFFVCDPSSSASAARPAHPLEPHTGQATGRDSSVGAVAGPRAAERGRGGAQPHDAPEQEGSPQNWGAALFGVDARATQGRERDWRETERERESTRIRSVVTHMSRVGKRERHGGRRGALLCASALSSSLAPSSLAG
jgi:hypothetical protein